MDTKLSSRSAGAFALLILAVFFCAPGLAAQTSRSTNIPYDSNWNAPPDSTWMALDSAHHQIFTAWPFRDRVDVLSTVDYHLISSIAVPSPSTLDISPDGSTLAVATGSHVLFFSTSTFTKTNDIVFPDAAFGISAFLYAANGNAMIRAAEGISTGGGITAYWNAVSNSFSGISNAENPTTSIYSTTGPLARSGDYKKIILGDASSGGAVQVIDANSGQIIWPIGGPYGTSGGGFGYGGYIDALAINKNASRYAVCVEPAGHAPYLLILDSMFNEIYQDQAGCIGMTFSGDGQSLYRAAAGTSNDYMQVLDMSSFSARYVHSYPEFYMYWEASDTSGMVYGVSPQIGSQQAGNEVEWIALDTTSSTAPPQPPPSAPLQIVRVVDNIGSPQGGDTIRMTCIGCGSSPTATIGGAPATVVSVATGPSSPGLSDEAVVTVTTPPGIPGTADVVLSSAGSTATASKGFQYANSRTIFPFSTSPTYLAFDSLRNRLYAAHQNQVEVIDVTSKTVLEPLLPVSGKLASSQFAGISLSPDQNRLYIADAGANKIHMINLASPGTGFSIDLATALGSSSPISPGRVFELSNGNLLGSTWSGYGQVFLINAGTQTGNWALDGFGNPIQGYTWGTANQGAEVLLGNGSGVGLWSVNAAANSEPATIIPGYPELAANEDGTWIADGGQGYAPVLIDFNDYSLGTIEQTFDVPLPSGTPGLLFHPSGALLYSAGSSNSTSVGSGLPTVQIEDIHHSEPAASVAFPEQFVQIPGGNNSDFIDHMLTIDPTGRYLFGVTQSGITMMVLNTVPLSIGNLQPAFVQPGGGQNVTVRGSGFHSGATVTIQGKQANATYVDANTLSVDVPALAAGWTDVTVTLADGATYTAPSLLQVIGAQPAPKITGFSPASVAVQSDIPGFDTTAPVTVLGSGFEVYDSIEINGQPVSSAFVDPGHIQATIPASLTGTTGSLSVVVVSPYDGSSRPVALPMVNPVPVVVNDPNISFEAGDSVDILLFGTGLVAGSTIQWNGQNVPTSLNGGETASGLELVYATVPGSLTQLTGNATITVLNPPPGGGVSVPLTATIETTGTGLQPTPIFNLIGPGDTLIGTYYTIPSTINFGTQVINSPVTITLSSQSEGAIGYSISSVTVSSGAFSTTFSGCLPSALESVCSIPLIFLPSSTGPFSGTLTVSDNLQGSPHTIALTGNAILTPVPMVTLTSINAAGQTTSAHLQGSAVVGGPSVSATAWVEYGTDQNLNTFTRSPSLTLSGDGVLSTNLSGLLAGTLYAARFAVQTTGGTGRSSIQLFATALPSPEVTLSLATGASNLVTLTAGQTATYAMMASSGGSGYVGAATVSCSGAPTGATCAVSPSQLNVSAAVTPFTVTVTTTAAATAENRSSFAGFNTAMGVLFGVGFIAFRKRPRGAGLLVCFAALCMLIASCGGGSGSGSGSGSGGGTGGAVTPTPAGTYNLILTVSVASVQLPDYILTLTVQ